MYIHAHGAIWKERGLLPSKGTPIKHGSEILKLLETVQKTKEVAVIHYKAYQSGNSAIIKGNQKADEVAKQADIRRTINLLLPTREILITIPDYREKK